MSNTLHKECALFYNPLKSPLSNGGTHLTSHTIHPEHDNPANWQQPCTGNKSTMNHNLSDRHSLHQGNLAVS